MAKKDSPEFSYDPKTELYRKKIKNHEGRWVPVYGKTQRELRDKIKQKQAEFERLEALRDNPYVYVYAKSWFDTWSKGRGYKDVEAIRGAVNNHILPRIGQKLVAEVTERDLENMLGDLSSSSKSLNSKVLRATKLIFKSAKKEGLIEVDPAADLKAGGQRTREKLALSAAQQTTLLSALAGTSIYLFVFLILHTGLRREEALGLQWDCVFLDVEHPYITVRRALRWENNRAILSDELKSAAAARKIPIDPDLVAILRDEKEKDAGPFVFGGTRAWTGTGFRRRWDAIEARSVGTKTIVDADGNEKTIEKKLGDKVQNHKVYVSIDFAVTPHQLRHTYITRLIQSGANIKVVQYLAGHASVKITLDIYTHLIEHDPAVLSADVLAAFSE